MESLKDAFGTAGYLIEAVGVMVVIIGYTVACARLAWRLPRAGAAAALRDLRHDLGRSLVLGLEFLIAGDIIRTVTVVETLESAGVLAVIVLIRVLLAAALEVDIEGRWPWRASPPDAGR